MTDNFTFQAPVRIIFGNGALDSLGQECATLGTDQIMLVTDEGISKTGAISTVIESLGQANIKPTVYTGAIPDPDVECIEKGLEVLHHNKCQALLGLGGGSSMDTAKAIALLATNPSPIMQYEGSGKFNKPALPLLMIPTTAGTGSETSPVANVNNTAEKRKFIVRGPSLYARVAILDPIVLKGMPKSVAVFPGMDAITHAVESYISRPSSLVTEMYSTTSLTLLARNIRTFAANRENLEAGANMLLASTLAGIAMGNARLGVVHAISGALGGRFHTAHGRSCALLLPACLESMIDAAVGKFAVMARIMEPEMEDMSDLDCAKSLPDIFARLISDLGIETGLSKVGIKESDLNILAGDTVKSAVLTNSPKDFSFDDILQILRRAC